MREMYFVCALVIKLSPAFKATPGVTPSRPARAEASRARSNDEFSFGEGRYQIEGKVPKGFTDFTYLYLEGAGCSRPVLTADV